MARARKARAFGSMKRSTILALAAIITLGACDVDDTGSEFRDLACTFADIELDASCDALVGPGTHECAVFTVTEQLSLTVDPVMVVMVDGQEIDPVRGIVELSPPAGGSLEVSLAPVADDNGCDPTIQCCLPREKVIDIKTKPTIPPW